MKELYAYILKPILFLFDPEFVHDFFTWTGEQLGSFSWGRKLVNYFYGHNGLTRPVILDGLTYQTPVVLGAGFDYDGRLTEILPAMSFGGVEVGSVTAQAYGGNQKPRLTRLSKSKSILVNKGLKNEGVDSLIERLQKRKRNVEDFVIGVSIARTNCKENSGIEAGIQDYAYSFNRLNEENVGDYYTINISCPNSFGGEAFTTPELLERLLSALKNIPTKRPVYIKMPINLPWGEFRKLLDVIREYSFINGVIIGNLNKNYKDLLERTEAPEEFRGGLSGLPTKKLSTDLIRQTRQYCGDNFSIIGCGGIFSARDAQDKINAGADLLQLITGMIYEGPHLMKEISEGVRIKK